MDDELSYKKINSSLRIVIYDDFSIWNNINGELK